MKKKREPVIVQSLAIAVPPERVWQALTSPRDLGQLVLGKVAMAATPGASFSWEWGVWKALAPRSPESGQGSFRWEGRVLAAVPGSTLVLGPSERALRASPEPVVTFIVQGEAGSTLLTVIQGGPEKGIEDYEHGWADFLLKLKTLLETERTGGELLVRALMRATPSQVYRAWLSAAALKKIIPGKAKVTPRARFGRVGQRFAWQHQLGQHLHQGTFLELEKNRTIAFTWESTNPASEVRIGIGAAPYGTLVSVQHAGLPRLSRGQLFAQRSFWSRLLERLRCYLYFKGQVRS